MIGYRIHFEPDGAHWVIQVREYLWGLVPRDWRTVVQQQMGDPDMYPVTFDSFEKADTYAKKIGLDRAYRQMGTRPWEKVSAGNV
jgi:hypothetical protein